ncbi:MAG: discoidin domain-containing protein [Prevotella sp.]|nr:discoidin domain-containing protein [Prevotella sp.]
MKKMMVFACALLFAVAAQAQWDLEGITVDKSKWVDFAPTWNPDPYIMTPGAGSIGSVCQSTKFSNGRGPRKAPQKAEGTTDLPEYWDNANTKHFPPVFNQAGGSCGVSSRAGYMLCEELNAYRGTDASHPDNRIAPNVQHPFDNTGPNKNTMAYQIGFPSVTVYGGFPYSSAIGFYGPTSDNAGWMQGYDKWYKTMHNRIWGASSIPTPVIGYPENNPEDWGRGGFGPGAIAAKRWLYNHNGDESFHTGGLLGLGVASGGKVLNIPSSTENRKIGLVGKKYWVTGTSVDHAVTISGYDDRVEFDLDGNGKVGERKNSDGLDEKGAWIVVNSWGGWANNGFIYVPYALATPTCKNNDSGKGYLPVGGGFTPEMWHIRKDYTPARTIKLKISFTQRSAISLKAGISTDLNATSPQKTLLFEHFNYKGDGDGDGKDAMTPMLGKWKDGVHYEPMELGFDLTDLLADFDLSQPLKFFFIIDSKASATGVGGIHEAYIIDYISNANGVETPFAITGDSVNIANQGGRTIISTVVHGEALKVPQNVRISGTTLSWETPQFAAYTPQGYVVYRNGTEVAQTAANETNYNIGTSGGTFTVKTVYTINGRRQLSGASAPVKGNLSFAQEYLNYVGTPISAVSELQDGMKVVLYNNGRGKYICDMGQNTYRFKGKAPGILVSDGCQYVFTVRKSGNTYTFTSANGSLPAFKSNNATIAVSQTAGDFTVTQADANNKTFYIKSGSWYLNGTDSEPVTWHAVEKTSQYKIIPVRVSGVEIEGLGDYTSVTASNLKDGQIVALYNNGRKFFVVDEGSTYAATNVAPTAQSYKYLFRVGKNANGTLTFTSINGAIPVLLFNKPFAPSDNADSFTATSAGTGLFFLQSSTAVASQNGKMERQYLNGTANTPVGYPMAESNSVYRIYPVTIATPAPVASIVAPTTIQASIPAQFSLTGDGDIASCSWTIDGKNYVTTAPTVTFASAGNKTVQCTVVNMKGKSSTISRTVAVQAAPALSADFTMSKSEVAGGERVSFLASNQLTGCTYHWNFPDTKELTADTRNASVVYTSIGQKNVTLTVTAPNGTQKSVTKTVTVKLAPPAPAFSLSDAVILKGESVTITDQSLYSPSVWSWTLLEEKMVRYQSNEQNPTFTPVPGRYEVLFTASNVKGDATINQKKALLVCNAPSYNGLQFTGGNNRVTANLPSGITSQWTVDFWLNPTALEDVSAGIFGSNDLQLTSNTAGVVTLKQGSTVLAKSAKAYYITDEWRHYAISYSNGNVIFYRDGVEFSRAACSVSDFSGHFNTIQIGGSAAPLQGMIDEFRVWNTALSAAKFRNYAVAPIADIPAAVQNDGLLLYYQFNQSGGNCTDATSYGNVGTRHNFGPDGDAWTESRGVFALNLGNNGTAIVGGMLNQTLYRVIDASDEEIVNESSPAVNVVDGKDGTMWHSKYKPSVVGYPHGITLDRSQLDEIYSLKIYAERGNDKSYLPTMINVYESDNATSWTPVLRNGHLIFKGNFGEVALTTPATRRFLKIEFPTGGTYLALNEIFFYGKDGNVIDNQENIQSESGYTVTWRIYDETGTKLWKLCKQTDVEAGTQISELPDTFRIKGCTYSPVSATVNRDLAIDVRCTWNQFSISTPNDTIYQHLKLNGKFARWDASTQKVLLRAARPGDDDMTGNWAFFGNPYSGYLVVNAAEPDLYLTGKAGNKEYAYLAVGGTRFSVRGSDHQGGGFLMQVGQSVAYLNDFANEGKLATWANANAASGAGSAFSATLVGETTGIETIENRQLTIANEHWYTISGMMLNGKPTTKGIYIYNGKKVVIK